MPPTPSSKITPPDGSPESLGGRHNDQQTSVADLREVVRQFVDRRDWARFHSPKNLAMALAIETAELMEHFQWLTPEQAAQVQHDPAAKHAAAEELADCLAYVLAIANTMEIDLATTLRAKMVRNARKYPPPESDSES